jgi:leucyl aminopeptidase (aminopeptidase T)
MNLRLERLMTEAAYSIATRGARLKKGSEILIICGKHNSAFAERLMRECYVEHTYPHLWVWDENLLPNRAKIVDEDAEAKLPRHTQCLLENSDLVMWLTQFENPKSAPDDLGMAVCSYWDQVYETLKGRPILYVSLLSAKCVETMRIEYETFLEAFANAVSVDYDRLRTTGSSFIESLEGRNMIEITDPNGTDLTLSIENRRVGMEVGNLEDCYSTGRECEVEVPGGEVYVAPIESSACGRLVADELRDFNVQRLTIDFEEGKITRLRADKGRTAFQSFLDKARGNKDRLAEFGMGINHGMKPIGLRIYDEKALGTAHVAIGNNKHLGGTNEASVHIDFILYKPTIKADNDFIMKEGHVTKRLSRKRASTTR